MASAAELPEIPQRELRNDASRVLREVRAGRSYTITVDGTPVADLVPHRNARRRTAVPREEVVLAFGGLSDASRPGDDVAQYVDDSIYDPYDRAHRRGQFAAEDAE
ncbi:type II toxin-antitoxin system Phd/YefM family antitoxin [Nocardia sp.]|uniref:type II toxin-antitoxin system Phd/YefM family antitoxin n=1 Tax=Nocardia sp. TaxID=1821 RepID=UPI002611CB40|nr:type II toxin-antitoxin system prevent-host-death family antitoxin [Nocardia sp.]